MARETGGRARRRRRALLRGEDATKIEQASAGAAEAAPPSTPLGQTIVAEAAAPDEHDADARDA